MKQNPADLMEPRAFLQSNDEDWRAYLMSNGNADAVQRSIAISLKRIADMLAETTVQVGADRGIIEATVRRQN